MNILQQEDLVKGLPDQALMQQAQMPTGELPQFLVVSEIQRREKMRKSFAETVPEQSVKDQILGSGIAAMNPATDPLMASAMGVDGGQDPMMQQQMPMQDPMQQQMQQQMPMQDPMMQQMEDPMMQQQMMAAGGGMMPYRTEGEGEVPVFKGSVEEDFLTVESLVTELERTREENKNSGLPTGHLDSNAMREDLLRGAEISNDGTDPDLLEYITAKESGGSKTNEIVKERQASALNIADQMRNARLQTPNFSGGGMTPHRMSGYENPSRVPYYSDEELKKIERLMGDGYTQERAEDIVRFVPVGETREDRIGSVYNYARPTDKEKYPGISKAAPNMPIPGSEKSEDMMKRILGSEYREYMLPGLLRGQGALTKLMGASVNLPEGTFQRRSGRQPETVDDGFDANSPYLLASRNGSGMISGQGNPAGGGVDVVPTGDDLTGGVPVDTGGGVPVVPTDFDKMEFEDVYRKFGNEAEYTPTGFERLKEIQGTQGEFLDLLDEPKYQRNSDFLAFNPSYDQEILDSQNRATALIDESRKDSGAQALIALGAGISEGNMGRGIRDAGTRITDIRSQGRKEAAEENMLARRMELAEKENTMTLGMKGRDSENTALDVRLNALKENQKEDRAMEVKMVDVLRADNDKSYDSRIALLVQQAQLIRFRDLENQSGRTLDRAILSAATPAIQTAFKEYLSLGGSGKTPKEQLAQLKMMVGMFTGSANQDEFKIVKE